MADQYDPYAIALGTLTGNPDPFMPTMPSSRAETTPLPRGVPAASMVPQPDFASAFLGQGDEGTADFQDVAPEQVDPFNMKRFHREPKAVPKLPLWALIATGLLDAVNLRQQIKPGRNRMQYQSPSGRTKTVYTARQAPASSNALATLLTGHATQKRAATADADKYNEALDLMGMKGSMEDVAKQREEERRTKKSPLAQFAATSPRVAEAGALDVLFPGQGKGGAFLSQPAPVKVPVGAQPSSDLRTAKYLLEQEGHTEDEPEWPSLLEEKMRRVAAMRGTPSGDSNANRAAALKNELDMIEGEVKKHKGRVEALKSRLAMQSAGMTPPVRARLEQEVANSESQIEVLTIDWNAKNQELYNLPTKQPVKDTGTPSATGSPRNESPTSNPLAGGVESGGSSSAPGVGAPAPNVRYGVQTGGGNLTEDQLTPDVIQKIRSNRDWKARAHQMFPHRPEFQ